MKATQRLLYKSFFAVFLLFAVYGCQTTDSTVTSEPSSSEPVSSNTLSDTEYVEPIVAQANTADKETPATSVRSTEESGTTDKKEKERIEQFGNYFLGKLQAHGGSVPPDLSGEKEAVNQDKPVADLAAKPAVIENRPYIGIEKKLYGKWINKLETESYDFHDDGTVTIIIEGSREKTMKLNGNFMIVGADRIKIDFRNDSFASRRPPSYFKISISENQFSLTDEPKKKGEPDGPTTKYNRVE